MIMKRFIYDVLDGGWYHILVPDKGKSNTAIMTVAPKMAQSLVRKSLK